MMVARLLNRVRDGGFRIDSAAAGVDARCESDRSSSSDDSAADIRLGGSAHDARYKSDVITFFHVELSLPK